MVAPIRIANDDAPPPSLVERAWAAARGRPAPLPKPEPRQPEPSVAAAPIPERSDRRVVAVVAVLLAAGPLATLAGAGLLERQIRAETAALAPKVTPLRARTAATMATRERLAEVLQRPTAGAVIERLAAALPGEARMLRAVVAAEGALEIEVLAPDPDVLRAALRREPLLAGLREVGQARTDGALRVTLRAETL